MEWSEEKALMQEQMRELHRELEREKKKAETAARKRDEANLRAHKAHCDGKSAVLGLERHKQDALRYQFLRAIGLRFPGSGDGYLHARDADRTVDQYVRLHNLPPTITEERADPAVSHRRLRNPLNPALPPELAERLALKQPPR